MSKPLLFYVHYFTIENPLFTGCLLAMPFCWYCFYQSLMKPGTLQPFWPLRQTVDQCLYFCAHWKPIPWLPAPLKIFHLFRGKKYCGCASLSDDSFVMLETYPKVPKVESLAFLAHFVHIICYLDNLIRYKHHIPEWHPLMMHHLLGITILLQMLASRALVNDPVVWWAMSIHTTMMCYTHVFMQFLYFTALLMLVIRLVSRLGKSTNHSQCPGDEQKNLAFPLNYDARHATHCAYSPLPLLIMIGLVIVNVQIFGLLYRVPVHAMFQYLDRFVVMISSL